MYAKRKYILRCAALGAVLFATGCADDCRQAVNEAHTLTKAAEVCGLQEVSCNLTHENIVAVIKAQKKAQACEARE